MISLGFGENITKAKFPSYHIIEDYMIAIWIITAYVNFDHLIKVVFATLSYFLFIL